MSGKPGMLALELLSLRLSKVKESPAFPKEDLNAMKHRLAQWRQEADEPGADGAAIAQKASCQLEEFLQGKACPSAVFLISDVHVDGRSDRQQNYAAALKDMAGLYPNARRGLVLAGDFTKLGTGEEYQLFYSLTEKYDPVGPENILIVTGNHDVRGPKEEGWTALPQGECPYWERAKGLYLQHNAPYMAGEKSLYHKKTLAGYTFLAMNTEKGLKDAPYMSQQQVAWLEENLSQCWEKDPEKPVFIVNHQPLNNTHWRSNRLDGFDGWSTQPGTGPTGAPRAYNTRRVDQQVKDILAKYPVGVFLSGHVHNQFGACELQIREYAALLDLPSLAEPEVGLEEVGTGYVAAFYPDGVVFRARNFVRGSWLPQYDQVLALPALPGLYQKARQNQEQPFAKSLEKAHALMTRCYDQEGLEWGDNRPADRRLFDENTLDTLESIRKDLLKKS